MRHQAPIRSHVSSTEDPVSVAEAAAAVAHAASVPGAPLQQVRASATVLANLLDENKDEQVLKESCLNLCQLFGEGIQNDRIQSILEAAVVPKLVHLLEPVEKRNGVFEFRVPVSVQSAALQVIGNIACGDDRQTQVIIDCNVLPCLRALLTCDERGIRKECCWIISNISESAHQVQDVIDAGILPYLLRLLESQDAACREDATWVLFNVTANQDEAQIDYLSREGCVRALCSLLGCTKELDVNWKGCSTIAEVALRGLRNVLAVGRKSARREGKRLNVYAAVVVNSFGVERIEALTHHRNVDIRAKARALLMSFFGAESGEDELPQQLANTDSTNSDRSTSSAESEVEDDDDEEEDSSLYDMSIDSVGRCSCAACSDLSRLPDKLPSGSDAAQKASVKDVSGLDICECCGGADVVGKTRTVLTIKIGRAVRLGHRHCLAVLLSRMTWSQRGSAIDVPTGVNASLLPPEAAMTVNLPMFVLAAQGGKADCLELLVCRCLPDLDMTYGKKRLTALACAAHKGNLRCCKILRESGASVSAKCADGVTALHLAASSGAYSVCNLLIEHGALVDARSAKRQTPLCLAAQRGHVNVVRLLLAEGANPNHEDDQGFTPLHLGALHGYDAVLGALIEAGANVNAKNAAGTTAICYAVQRRHAKCVRILINGGAKLCVPGSSPLLFIAADEGDVECVKALLDSNTPLDCRANIKVLINKDYEMMDSLSPLHLAASKGHNGMVELLLDRGADVDERSSKGWSALDFAVLNGHVTSANTLIFYGAIVDDGPKVIGRGSWTLVQHAAHSGNKEIVRLLIQRLQEQKTKGVISEPVTNGRTLLQERAAPSKDALAANGMNDRRKKVRDGREDDKEFLRKNRDVRRWELEAAEARERLEEAIVQRSILKLKEASAFANKILLHMAAGTGDDESLLSSDSAAQVAIQNISVGLSSDIDQSRKILAEMQLQERQQKEKRDAAAANARKANARKQLRESMEAVRNGSDVKLLQRSLKKAGLILDPDDETLSQATELSRRIARAQEIDRRLSNEFAECNLAKIEESMEALAAEVQWHMDNGTLRALERVLGCKAEARISGARIRLENLRAEKEAARAEEERLRKAENDALSRLETAAKHGVLAEIEASLQEIAELSSKDASVRDTVSNVRKTFQKLLKIERRKLRQACSSEDRDVIRAALAEAKDTGLLAMEADVAAAEQTLNRLEEREFVLSEFEAAKSSRDVQLLQKLRSRLEDFGLLEQADQARVLGESLQKEERINNQLSTAIASARTTLDAMKAGETVWPDGKRLADMIKRGRNFASASDLVEEGIKLAGELGAAGVSLVRSISESGEARAIASAIEAFEKAYPSSDDTVPTADLFGHATSREVLSCARDRLADIQREEQQKALAELEAHTAALKALDEVSREARDTASRSSDWEMDPVAEPGDFVDPVDDEDGSEHGDTDAANCTHYYLWRGGNTVACSRCGNARNSSNAEWLVRVRRRTQKGSTSDDRASQVSNQPLLYRDVESAPNATSTGPQAHRDSAEYGFPAPSFHVQNLLPSDMTRRLMRGSEPTEGSHLPSLSGNRVHSTQEESAADISAEFARQHFGFDIDAIINDS
mmetsp:Transcript_6234/g.18805  ORF Transcript_6234/g.18805 Transcript_6234/m.18805 type:complete len:1604 (+) Transcript_6234:403-5214(+)